MGHPRSSRAHRLPVQLIPAAPADTLRKQHTQKAEGGTDADAVGKVHPIYMQQPLQDPAVGRLIILKLPVKLAVKGKTKQREHHDA